jgi:hypothetical protein
MNDPMVVLTQADRDKFSAWLKQDVESNREIIIELQKLPYAEAVVKQKKQQMAACIIVANLLDSIEDQIVSG